jgi:hypothetical protein
MSRRRRFVADVSSTCAPAASLISEQSLTDLPSVNDVDARRRKEGAR